MSSLVRSMLVVPVLLASFSTQAAVHSLPEPAQGRALGIHPDQPWPLADELPPGLEANAGEEEPGHPLPPVNLPEPAQMHGWWGLAPVAAVPEPATWALLAVGLGLVGWRHRRS